MSIPSLIQNILSPFSVAFTQPSWERFVYFLIAAILTPGARTVNNMIRTLEFMTWGSMSGYHRFLSFRKWSSWKLAYCLCNILILTFFGTTKIIHLAGDDTVDGHRGKNVFGKARHRDAVRSSRSYTAFRWGHKWVVLAFLVHLPLSRRVWALPCLVALYQSKEGNSRNGNRHKTPSEIMSQLLSQLQRWFPSRKFIFSGDQGFGTHQIAQQASRSHGRLVLVSKLLSNANLRAPAPARRYSYIGGRPKTRGRKLPSPKEVVSSIQKRIRLNVKWYGGGERKVEIVSSIGLWFKGYHSTEIRWVYVHDLTGTHRDEYFFSTDTTLTPKQIIECYVGRWSIETTFQEMRSYLGLETTRGWKKETVLRTAPLLFGLYSIIVYIYSFLPAEWKNQTGISWTGKTDKSFSDMITATRRWLWIDWVFVSLNKNQPFPKLPYKLRQTLFYCLAPAS
jgi:hypothetical protein